MVDHELPLDAQRRLYGETFAERLSRLREGYRVSQGRLAAVVGLSAPMMSQLVSGQRTKISNPVVYARVVRLEQQLADEGLRAGDPARIEEILEEVAASSPQLTTVAMVAARPVDSLDGSGGGADGSRQDAIGWLAGHASAVQLSDLAEHAVHAGAEVLAGALAEAARKAL